MEAGSAGPTSYLFIAGCARSGTSVMRRLISADPNTAIGIERYIHYLLSNGQLTPELFEPERFMRLQKGDTFYDDFAFFREYKEVIERYPSARIRGDKIPRIYDYYPQFERYFPGAKIVFTLRNLYDVALSFDRRASDESDRFWPATRNYEAAIAAWNRSVRNTLDWAERLNICVVSYESLFLRGVGVERVSAELGLDSARLAERLTLLRSQGEEFRQQQSAAALSVDAKLRILEKADGYAYRELIGRFLCNPLENRSKVVGTKAAGTSDSTGAPHEAQGAAAPAVTIARPSGKGGLSRYADIDFEAFDYQCFPIGGYPLWVRGPKPEIDLSRPYVAVLGAASAFGRCVNRPYSSLIGQRLGIPVLNLGYGGAKPGLYLEDRKLCELIRGAKIVISEFMSARGFPNSFVEARNSHSAIVRLRAGAELPRQGGGARLFSAGGPTSTDEPGPWVFADQIYQQWVRSGEREKLQLVVAEMRSAYVSQMCELLRLCSGFKLLFWFSQRSPDYHCTWDSLDGLTGGFPHFVNGAVVSALREHADDYVESCAVVGLPSKMVSRLTGAPLPLFPHNQDASLNYYYPSQEMHVLAADAIVEKLGSAKI